MSLTNSTQKWSSSAVSIDEGSLKLDARICQTHSSLHVENDEDHESFRLTYKIAMAITGCSIAFVGSQMIPLFWFTLYPLVANELGADSFVWLKAGSSIGQIAASVTLGPVSDLFGRKIMFLFGILCSIVGMVACAATSTQGGFIAGQTVAGFGFMMEELLALAITAELVPTKKRHIYVAAMVSGFLPWAPGVLYAQLLAAYNWRWVGCLIAVWHVLAIVTVGVFYNPPSRPNSKGLSPMEIFNRIDFVGVGLGLAGTLAFTIGVFWGGGEYPWRSAHVIGMLSAGLGFTVIFVIWETLFAKYPLFPRRMVRVKRVFWPIMFVLFMSNINFGPLAVFWPIQSTSVYESDHRELGVNALPVGFCIVGGAVISAALCGIYPKRIRLIITLFCVLQAAGAGGMTAVNPNNINTVWAPLVIGLFGVGGVLFPSQVIMTVVTPDDLIATVTSLTFTVRGISQIVALAIMSNRLTINVTKNALKLIAPAAVKAGVRSIPEIVELVQSLVAIPFKVYVPQHLPYITDSVKYELLREACIEAFGRSFPELWWIGCGFGIAACIASTFVCDVSQYMNGHVAVVLH